MVEVAERSSRLETFVKQGAISTPALIIDLDVLERNLQRMAAYCREHRLGLRPHTKTHKTREVKVGEEEVMATAANAEILVAYPIFGVEKLRHLAALAKTRTILMALDDEATAREASRAARAQQPLLVSSSNLMLALDAVASIRVPHPSHLLRRFSKCRGSSFVV